MVKLGLFMLTPLAVLASWAAAITSGQESITVTVIGKLQTGVMAIGGETTGATITANTITWELEKPRDVPAETWDALSGKLVKVTGTLRKQRGVERKERLIVAVTNLQAAERSFEVTPGKEDVKFEISQVDKTLVCEVHSSSGIGSATLERLQEQWPDKIVLRMHLTGLESCRVESGAVALNWSVSSTDKPITRMTLHQGTEETVLISDSSYFTEVKLVAKVPQIPLKDGYLEVTLPAKLLEGNPQMLKIQWIDFYRR